MLSIETLLRRAAKSLEAARFCLANEDGNGAANRCYVAAFDAVRAALLYVGQDVSTVKTHNGVERLFGAHLIRTGILPAEAGRTFSELMEERRAGDYRGDEFSSEDARLAVESAGQFVTRIETLISGDSSKQGFK